MSVFGSWVVTLGFLFVVFLAGKVLQYKEKRDRITKRAQEAITRENFVTVPNLGTLYGGPTQYERRQAPPSFQAPPTLKVKS